MNEHHSPGDIWIIIDKKIYNISDWVLKHPGGLIITNVNKIFFFLLLLILSKKKKWRMLEVILVICLKVF